MKSEFDLGAQNLLKSRYLRMKDASHVALYGNTLLLLVLRVNLRRLASTVRLTKTTQCNARALDTL